MLNHRKTVNEVARRLPHLRRREVAEVLEVVAELWMEELIQPEGAVTVMDLGRLTMEVQQMRVTGAVRQARMQQGKPFALTMPRIYARFRPSPKLRQAVKAQRKGQTHG